MKTSTILLTFCAIAVTSTMGGEWREMIRIGAEKCIEETGVDPNVLERMKTGEDIVFDDRVKCFGACVMKVIGMMAEDGTVDAELAKSHVSSDAPHREKIFASIDACANERGADECETGHVIAMCMHKRRMRNMAHQK